MWKKLFEILIIVGILLSITTTVYPWDGERKGFILGGGLGFGITSYKDTLWEGDERQTKGTLMTDFKIGYAKNNQVAFYFTNKTSWFSRDFETTGISSNERILSALTGGGITYFVNPSARSLFVSGGFGVLSWSADMTTSHNGAGFFVGGGYEFAKYFNAEFNLIYGQPYNPNTVLTFMVTINVLGY